MGALLMIVGLICVAIGVGNLVGTLWTSPNRNSSSTMQLFVATAITTSHSLRSACD
jgi:F0F1-type ATP synthase membrane subunit c/vacuolar-type H+-ATPase subunit K